MKVLLATVVALTTVILCSAADPECTKRKSSGQPLHWANSKDCGRFYRCSAKNVKREIICPPEKEYNAKTGKCSAQGKGTCKLRPIDPIKLIEPVANADVTDIDIVEAADVNENNTCIGVNSGTFRPKVNFCQEFYICNQTQAIQQTCGSGSYFEPDNGNCIPDVNKTCWQNFCIGQDNGTYLADPKNCRDFYMCNGNETIRQNCDSGSYFDATSGNCQPDAYQKCWQNKCIGQMNGTIQPDYDSCLIFYICNNNETTRQNCNSGSYFNETTLNCRPDDNNTKCWENYCLMRNNSEVVADNADCYKYYECQERQAIAKACPQDSYFNKLTLSCEMGMCPDETTTAMPTESTTVTTITEPAATDDCTCPGGYKKGDMVASPKSCNLFLICDNSELLEQSCQPGNYFNAQLRACTRDVNGTCADSKFRSVMATRLKRSTDDEAVRNDEKPNEEVVAVVVAEELPKTEVAEVTTTAPPKCLGLYEEGELVPNPEDCQNFHVCFGGAMIDQSCGVGNFFNGSEKVCQPDVKSLCRPKVMSVSNEEVAHKLSNAKSEPCTCPGGYVGGDILRHPTDCDKFYICFDSELQPSECGVGNKFDVATKTCMRDTEGTCWPKTTSPDLNCTCPGGYVEGQMVPYPDNCRLFYICHNSALVKSDCGKGNRYDNAKQACIDDTDGTCTPSASICKNQPDNTMLPNPTQCDGYYICVKGVPEPGTCEPDDWFDPDRKSCVQDIDAKCKNPCANTTGEITLVPHKLCSKFYVCNNGQATVGNCKDGEGFVPQLQRCAPGGCSNNNTCVGKKDGTTSAVPNDPHSFYYCLNGVQMQRQCGNDSIYNEKYGICMLQPSSDCNQQLCANAKDGKIAPTLKDDENSFCGCKNGSAYKHPCPSGYTFNTRLNICYSNAPCDPQLCVNSKDFTAFADRNCTQCFCLCMSNEPVSVRCPKNGTYYPNLQECRQPVPQDPNCDPNYCLTAPPNKAFPSKSPNTSSFCYCRDGGAVSKDCLNGYVFNKQYSACFPVEKTCSVDKCRSGTTVFFPANGDIESFCYCDAGTVRVVKCPNATRYDDTFKACLADPCDQSYCLKPSNAFTVFTSKSNPHIFCYCNGDQATWRACGDGTVFNDDAKACLPEAPDCDIKLCANATIGHAFPVPAKNDSHGFCYCTSPVSVTKFSCVDDKLFDPVRQICLGIELCEGKYQQYQTIADPESCIQYLVCLNGKMLKQTCADGMYYNNATNQCLPNDNGQCKISQGSNCTCPGGYEDGKFVMHPDDCQRFYICSNSTLHESDCGDGNRFDEAVGYCVRDTAGICKKSTTRTCVGNFREGDLVPNPDDAQMYFICYKAHLQPGNCGIGNIFDRKLLHCVPGLPGVNQRSRAAITKRSAPDYHDQNCSEGAKRSVPANCSQYETCFNGNWTRTNCSQHLYYNPDKQLCLEPHDDTICSFARVAGLPSCDDEYENQVIPSRNQQCANYLRCSRGKWRLKNCPKQQYFSVRLNTCITTENNATCHEVVTPIQPNTTSNAVTLKCAHTQVSYYQPNCAMYYMCLDDEWWIQHCPLGMYFNRTQNFCVPNNNGQCKIMELQSPATHPPTEQHTQTNCSKEGALRASPMGCEHYYVCVAGMWFQQTCASKQYYNATQETCMPLDGSCASASNSTLCVAGSRQVVPLNCTAFMHCSDDGASWQRFNCPINYYFHDVLKMCVPSDGSCASNGLRRACNGGDIKPHPDRRICGEFLHCEAQSGWQLETCLKGYTYSLSAQACLLGLRDGNCTLSKPDEGNTTSLPGENLCFGKMDGVSVRHASDCSKFHICLNETSTKEQTCPDGSFFDVLLSYCRPNDGTCQLPLNGPCEGQLDGTLVPNPQNCSSYYKCSTLNGTQLQACAMGEFFHNLTRQCRLDRGECRNSSAVNICAGQKHGIRLPHETYCNRYYACVRGVAVQANCSDEHKFSEYLHRCVPDTEHECQNGLFVDKSNSTQRCANLTDGAFIVNKRDCTKYYICSAGKALRKRCNAGSYFDATQLLCVPDNGTCPFVDNGTQIVPPDPIVCVGRHGDLMPDPANCNDFYVCINGKLHPERCYEQHFFNATLNQCQARANLTTNSKQTSLAPKTVKPTQCQQQPSNLTSLCAKLEAGASLAEQGDCRRYIACNDGEAISQRCRNGESFDSLLGVCRQNDGTCLLENGERVGDCNGKHGQITRNADNCRGYFVCINGQKLNAECAKDEYFNKTLNLCQPDLLLQCNITVNETGNQTSVGILTTLKRYPEEKLCTNAVVGQRYVNIIDRCRSFYMCLGNGTVQYEHCPEGNLFDSVTSKCEVAELVPCNKT